MTLIIEDRHEKADGELKNFHWTIRFAVLVMAIGGVVFATSGLYSSEEDMRAAAFGGALVFLLGAAFFLWIWVWRLTGAIRVLMKEHEDGEERLRLLVRDEFWEVTIDRIVKEDGRDRDEVIQDIIKKLIPERP